MDKDQNVGVFFFVLLGSLALGIVISGVRALVMDYIYTRGIRIRSVTLLSPITIAKVHFDQLVDENRLNVYESVVESYYRFYQFYANTFVALGFFTVARIASVGDGQWPLLAFVLVAVLLILLFFSARMSLDWYSTAIARLFTAHKDGTNEQRPAARTPPPEEEAGEEARYEEDDAPQEGTEEGP